MESLLQIHRRCEYPDILYNLHRGKGSGQQIARAAAVADEAIAEAVGRYLHEAMLEEEERREGSEPA